MIAPRKFFKHPSAVLFTIAFLTATLLGQSNFVTAFAREVPSYDELTFPPLEVSTPNFERYALDNGLMVYLMEDHTLPFVGGNLMFHAGEYQVSPEQAGLAQVTGAAMREGGTTSHSPEALDELLAQKAASISTDIGSIEGSARFSTETSSTEAVVALFTEVVSQPAFDDDQVAQIKSAFQANIARQADDLEVLSEQTWQQLTYGTDSYAGRIPTEASLAQIDADAVRAFYQQTVTPQGAILGVVGDFDSEAMKGLLDETLGQWENSSVIAAPSIPNPAQITDGLFVVDQPQTTQSSIYMGHSGKDLRSPYHAPMRVLEEVLNARMNQEIRSRQGLTYGVWASWHAGFVTDGAFSLMGSTASETTVPFIQAMQRELERLRQVPITEAELAIAKDKLLNSFIYSFETPEAMTEQMMTLEFYGYPDTYFEQRNQLISQVDVQQVFDAAQTMIRPEDMVVVVVGNVDAMGDSLEAFGKEMTVIDTDTFDADTRDANAVER